MNHFPTLCCLLVISRHPLLLQGQQDKSHRFSRCLAIKEVVQQMSTIRCTITPQVSMAILTLPFSLSEEWTWVKTRLWMNPEVSGEQHLRRQISNIHILRDTFCKEEEAWVRRRRRGGPRRCLSADWDSGTPWD